MFKGDSVIDKLIKFNSYLGFACTVCKKATHISYALRVNNLTQTLFLFKKTLFSHIKHNTLSFKGCYNRFVGMTYLWRQSLITRVK